MHVKLIRMNMAIECIIGSDYRYTLVPTALYLCVIKCSLRSSHTA